MYDCVSGRIHRSQFFLDVFLYIRRRRFTYAGLHTQVCNGLNYLPLVKYLPEAATLSCTVSEMRSLAMRDYCDLKFVREGNIHFCENC